MNEQLIDQLQQIGIQPNVNGLPYAIPIHQLFVHFTIGLFIIAIFFDIAGTLFSLGKPIFRLLDLPVLRSNFYDVGWYNLVAATAITFITVAFGFFEILLAAPPTDTQSAWGLGAGTTMIIHGVCGVLVLAAFVGIAVWRGFQRYRWRKDRARQVQWSYLAAGVVVIGALFFQGTLGAQMGGDFGIHTTAANLLREGGSLSGLK